MPKKRICPICKKPQSVEEDKSVSPEMLAYGSNDAGLRIKVHFTDGKKCEGSNIILQ